MVKAHQSSAGALIDCARQSAGRSGWREPRLQQLDKLLDAKIAEDMKRQSVTRAVNRLAAMNGAAEPR
jgi:hypothetical protein